MDGTRAAMVRVSPDGERLTIGVEGANDDVWIYELARGTMSPLTMDWDASEAIWAPDGKNITLLPLRSGLRYRGCFSSSLLLRPWRNGSTKWLWTGVS